MTWLLSIDPGVKHCGVALFRNLVLQEADLIDSTDLVLYAKNMPANCYLAIEKPQVYQGASQKGDPNDLIDLAIVVGRILGAAKWKGFSLYKPREWKGQVPKDVMAKRIKVKLSRGEASNVKAKGHLAHNVWDAVGIGLHHLGRMR